MTFRLDGVQVQSHGVVYYDDISQPSNSNANSFQCLTDNEACCASRTGGHWYFPNRTQVSGGAGGPPRPTAIYRTRGRNQPEAAVYLHRDPVLSGMQVADRGGVGLYRCEIPTSGTQDDIKVDYVGVYVRGSSDGECHMNVYFQSRT